MANIPSLGRFVLRTFLWLPPCLALWYSSALYHAAFIGHIALPMVNLLTSGKVTALEQSGVDLVFVTSLVVYPAPERPALLLPEVNPLIYTYGLAFFLALMLAEQAKVWKILAGAAILVFFQSWGVAFDVLAQIGVRLGPEVAAQAGLSGWRGELITLGYQLGALIFPSLIPVVLWAGGSRLFIDSFSSSARQHHTTSPH